MDLGNTNSNGKSMMGNLKQYAPYIAGGVGAAGALLYIYKSYFGKDTASAASSGTKIRSMDFGQRASTIDRPSSLRNSSMRTGK